MIRTEAADRLYVVSLNRPERRNALTPAMFEQFLAAIDSTPADARAIVIAGEGDVFCSGFDLKLCLETPGTLESLLRALSAAVRRLRQEQAVPVVVAAHGAAIAGGCALLGAGDVVVSDASAKIGYPVTPLGISPAVSAAYLRLCIGDGRARARMLDPRLVSGEEAAAIGLVHECLPDAAGVRPRAMEIARGLASKPPVAMAATRRWLAELEQHGHQRDADAALGASLSIVDQPEQQERLRAMLQPKPAR